MLDAARFEPFGLTLVQAHCYLTEFADKLISDEKLALLQESFDNLRRRGLKAVLRFAYERDMGVKEGPTPDWILRHIDQLQPLLCKSGELFWSDQGFDGKAARGKGVDGLNAAVRMRLHHYSSFSVAHSYAEREGKPYSIDRWLSTAITPEPLRQAAMPVGGGWFEDGFGQRVTRTQFEYIQDHLGYRLELQSARIPEQVMTGAEFKVEIELINRGFSTMGIRSFHKRQGPGCRRR